MKREGKRVWLGRGASVEERVLAGSLAAVEIVVEPSCWAVVDLRRRSSSS